MAKEQVKKESAKRENLSSEKIVCRGKFSSGKNIRHLTKISLLFPDEVFPDKVVPKQTRKLELYININNN